MKLLELAYSLAEAQARPQSFVFDVQHLVVEQQVVELGHQEELEEIVEVEQVVLGLGGQRPGQAHPQSPCSQELVATRHLQELEQEVVLVVDSVVRLVVG